MTATDAFRKFSDWILGSRVAGIRTSDGRTPSWSLILNFEKEARGKMYESVRDGSAPTIKDAVDMIIKRADVVNTHLIIPCHRQLRSSPMRRRTQALPPVGEAAKGPAKARKEREKARSTSQALGDKQWAWTLKFYTRKPDGKPICFAYQKSRGCPNGAKCKFIHVCKKCLGNTALTSARKGSRRTQLVGRRTDRRILRVQTRMFHALETWMLGQFLFGEESQAYAWLRTHCLLRRPFQVRQLRRASK